MKNIVAVVVTFNRLALLKECITSLRAQTHPPDAILVVNNGSTDGTGAWLENQRDVSVVEQENLGGAGGFYRGIKEASSRKYDWIWVMDDDAFPQERCLEKLILAAETTKRDDIVLAPLILEGNKIDSLHRGHIDFKKLQYPLQVPIDAESFYTKGNLQDISFASFIGMFLSRKVVEKAGLPRQNYFIFHDDVEYSIRIKSTNSAIYLVKDAIIYHKVKSEQELQEYSPLSAPMNYRSLKEKIHYRRTRYASLTKADVLHFIGKRNWIHTVVVHQGFSFALMRHLLKDLLLNFSYVLFSKTGNMRLFYLYAQIYFQGATGKFDNRKFLH